VFICDSHLLELQKFGTFGIETNSNPQALYPIYDITRSVDVVYQPYESHHKKLDESNKITFFKNCSQLQTFGLLNQVKFQTVPGMKFLYPIHDELNRKIFLDTFSVLFPIKTIPKKLNSLFILRMASLEYSFSQDAEICSIIYSVEFSDKSYNRILEILKGKMSQNQVQSYNSINLHTKAASSSFAVSTLPHSFNYLFNAATNNNLIGVHSSLPKPPEPFHHYLLQSTQPELIYPIHSGTPHYQNNNFNSNTFNLNNNQGFAASQINEQDKMVDDDSEANNIEDDDNGEGEESNDKNYRTDEDSSHSEGETSSSSLSSEDSEGETSSSSLSPEDSEEEQKYSPPPSYSSSPSPKGKYVKKIKKVYSLVQPNFRKSSVADDSDVEQDNEEQTDSDDDFVVNEKRKFKRKPKKLKAPKVVREKRKREEAAPPKAKIKKKLTEQEKNDRKDYIYRGKYGVLETNVFRGCIEGFECCGIVIPRILPYSKNSDKLDKTLYKD